MAQPITNLPLESKIKFGSYGGNPIVWKIADKNHEGYPANSVTLLSEVILFEKAFDAKEPSSSNTDRQSYGNNRYRDSNIRQWLNKAGNPWYVATHSADAPPASAGVSENPYDTEVGFLSAFTDIELDLILDTTLTVALNTITDGGGSEEVVDKIFLLSNTEVGLANENSIVEGNLLPIFSNDASRIATHVGAADYWWLRTPNASNSRNVRHVGTSGALSNSDAYSGDYGVRPALNLKSEIFVSDVADTDGAYAVVNSMTITLDKPITINAGETVEKIKFTPKVNNTELTLKSTDVEKLVYEGEKLDAETVDLEIEGKDGQIDNIAYTIS